MSNVAVASIIGIGIIVAVLLWLRERRRADVIRTMAAKYGFHYLGSALPRSLTLSGTPVERATATWNVIDGDRNGVRIIAFDCRIGYGKASWRRTVIAAQTPRDKFDIVPFTSDLKVERSGKWAILYQPKTFALIPPGLMSVPALEAHLNAIELQ